ncbi:unnamed protein product [Tilletia laevis]|uniref:Uncharacterized protein n=1 Tax=Tilletia laevis TaxID=157183 RepID=A0A9N8LCQ6_9BASI|nr:unnamed protein product [Tilletia caries]CAD6904391.1 unnamed protein product [Tilletia laevis]CAD6905155.1 unnamed protein product [Tilletia laevis]
MSQSFQHLPRKHTGPICCSASETANVACGVKSIIRFQTVGGELQYEETSRQEASVMSDLEGKDLLVYTHIRDSDNEGIWTKTINFAPISTRQ